MGRKDLKERMDKMFQIFEKSFYRKHIIYILMSRARPKVEKSQGRRLQFSSLELLKNRRKILRRITNGSS